MPKPLLTLLLALGFFCGYSQHRTKLLTIDFANYGHDGGNPEYEFIRTGNNDLRYLYQTRSYETRFRRHSVALKMEVRSKNDKLALSSGLRLNFISSTLDDRGNGTHMYFLYRQVGNTTEYLRIDDIKEENQYLSIPLEAKYLVVRKKSMSFFCGIGAEIGYRIRKSTKIDFYTDAMDAHRQEVIDMFGSSSDFFSTIYGIAGFTFGKEKPRFSVIFIPPTFLATKVSGLVNPSVGIGFSLQYHVNL